MTPEDRAFLRSYSEALDKIDGKALGQRGGKNDPLGKVKARFERDARFTALADQTRKIGLWHRNRLLGLPQPDELSAELDAMF